MEVTGGARLASFGRLAAVGECSRSSGRKLSEPPPYNCEPRKDCSVHTQLAAGTDNGNSGSAGLLPRVTLYSEGGTGGRATVRGRSISSGVGHFGTNSEGAAIPGCNLVVNCIIEGGLRR
jgi:hypothetical protein